MKAILLNEKGDFIDRSSSPAKEAIEIVEAMGKMVEERQGDLFGAESAEAALTVVMEMLIYNFVSAMRANISTFRKFIGSTEELLRFCTTIEGIVSFMEEIECAGSIVDPGTMAAGDKAEDGDGD